MNQCPSCGGQVRPEATYCRRCGTVQNPGHDEGAPSRDRKDASRPRADRLAVEPIYTAGQPPERSSSSAPLVSEKCAKCGAPVDYDSSYCRHCGTVQGHPSVLGRQEPPKAKRQVSKVWAPLAVAAALLLTIGVAVTLLTLLGRGTADTRTSSAGSDSSRSAPSESPERRNALLARWTGPLTQTPPSETAYGADVILQQLDRDGDLAGQIEYPELRCGGTLTYIGPSRTGGVRLLEEITFGIDRCTNGGVVALVAARDKPEAAFRWTRRGSDSVVEGVLQRVGG